MASEAGGKRHDAERRLHFGTHTNQAAHDLAARVVDPRPLLALTADRDRGGDSSSLSSRKLCTPMKSSPWSGRFGETHHVYSGFLWARMVVMAISKTCSLTGPER